MTKITISFLAIILIANVSITFAIDFRKPLKPIIINHASVEAFNSIPDNNINIASDIKMLFLHASIGSQITIGLDCLAGTRTNPQECTGYPKDRLNRDNFVFRGFTKGGFYGKVNEFDETSRNEIDNYDVFSFKYCYLEGLDLLQEPCGKDNNTETIRKSFEHFINKMESLEADYPEKLFIWWTIPLTQVGQACTDSLNALIRQFANAHNKILFDIADMESHDTNNIALRTDKGLEYAFKYYCGEQKPDAQACHPSWPGKILIGKNFWVLLNELALLVENQSSDIRLTPYDANINFSFNDNQLIISAIDEQLFSANIKIINLLGTHVSSDVIKNGQNYFHIDLSHLSKGVYFVLIQTNLSNKIFKLAVQ